MSEGPKTALKLLGIGLVYVAAWFGAYSTPDWQWLLLVFTVVAFTLNTWTISSTVLKKWGQPERAIGSLVLATIPTYLATMASFAAAASTFGV